MGLQRIRQSNSPAFWLIMSESDEKDSEICGNYFYAGCFLSQEMRESVLDCHLRRVEAILDINTPGRGGIVNGDKAGNFLLIIIIQIAILK
ncbi:hypothetical protein AVEN_97557-1 [Araneus ventricosus]|uniref:Uncharacterized protein n=1 Tax=Araneus ventricosus TaxID=182803 RepID=A0A4Y2J721_ARAVE|nr:hypothetical protein AVEN_97557-1 [Araneus ventricosus]